MKLKLTYSSSKSSDVEISDSEENKNGRNQNVGANEILPARLIFVYIWLLWGKPGSLEKPVVYKILFMKKICLFLGKFFLFLPR